MYQCPYCLKDFTAYMWDEMTKAVSGQRITTIKNDIDEIHVYNCPNCGKPSQKRNISRGHHGNN